LFLCLIVRQGTQWEVHSFENGMALARIRNRSTRMALSMPSTKALLDEYGLRFEEVIAESGDPAVAMDIIAVEAERVGLIDSAALPRREDVWSFVMDLW